MAEVKITYEGKEYDVTSCANQNCGRVPTLPFNASKDQRDAYKKAMDDYMLCAKKKCLTPILIKGGNAPVLGSGKTVVASDAKISVTDENGNTTNDKKNIGLYVAIGVAVLVIGFVAYKKFRK